MTALSKIPRTNVSVADIRDTLNANGGSVTNVLGTFFSSAANINIWARQKPIHWRPMNILRMVRSFALVTKNVKLL